MANGIGYPKGLTPDIPVNGQNGQRPTLTPQQAVRILSLRVPERVPFNAPINAALLNSPGGSAPGAGGLQSMIQQLIQAIKPALDVPAPVLTRTGVPEEQRPSGLPTASPGLPSNGRVGPGPVAEEPRPTVHVPGFNPPTPSPAPVLQPSPQPSLQPVPFSGAPPPPRIMPGDELRGPSVTEPEPPSIGDPWGWDGPQQPLFDVPMSGWFKNKLDSFRGF